MFSVRRCGGCTLCCTILSVPPQPGFDGTARWCHCKYALGGKCQIYVSRPGPCRDFNCLWLTNDIVPKRFRPDKVGAVFTESKENNAIIVHTSRKVSEQILDNKNEFANFILGLSQRYPLIIATKSDQLPIGRYAHLLNISVD
jgi:hypothetical protein